MKKLIPALLVATLFFVSCDQSEFEEGPGKYGEGAFVLNEGTYGSSNASVSFISFGEDSIYNDIFYAENNRPVGDVLQSMAIKENLAYLVVNNSDKVEVANRVDFTEAATIEGLDLPRYMAFANSKGYITQWGSNGSVAVVNLSTYTVSKTIAAGAGPEGIIVANGKVIAANGGGFFYDSTLMVINPSADTIERLITVGYNPKEMVLDKQGDIWVLCYGHVVYNPDWTVNRQFPSKLVKVSADDFSVEKEIIIGETLHPQHLDISPDGQNIYVGAGFGFGGIFKIAATATLFPAAPFIAGYYYGFNIDQRNGDVYACEAPDFTNPGIVRRFSEGGILQKEYTAGVGPNSVIFR